MKGYLTPDQYGDYGFVPDFSVPFRFGPQNRGTCTPVPACESQRGFAVSIQDGVTLAPVLTDWFATGGGDPTGEAVRMAETLENAAANNVVRINAMSPPLPGQKSYASMAMVDKSTMVRLANAVAGVGGTRNTFNQIARLPGDPASNGMTYALVGWKNAREGAGAEVGAGVYGAGPSRSLNGNLRPNLQSQMRPAQVTPAEIDDGLSTVLLEPPSNQWPLDNNPGASAALSWLGTKFGLSADPRVSYWQLASNTNWANLAEQVTGAAYSDVPPGTQAKFTLAQFNLARARLARELQWVGKVNDYTAAVARPFDKNIINGWTDAQTIASQIYEDASEPGNEGVSSWLEYTEILLDLAIPLTADVSGEIASMLELGMFLSSGSASGAPSEIEFRYEAAQLGSELVKRMQTAANSYQLMADVIVSDPGKLQTVGSQANCVPGDGCDGAFSFLQSDATRVSANIVRSIRRYAWSELLPLEFSVFHLNPDDSLDLNGGLPRNPADYGCGFYHPWSYYSSTQLKYATTALLQQFDPGFNKYNGWQLLVMSVYPGATTVHGTPPSDDLLNKVFTPSGPGNDPDLGGVGLHSGELMAEQEWQLWSPNDDTNPPSDYCYWPG